MRNGTKHKMMPTFVTFYDMHAVTFVLPDKLSKLNTFADIKVNEAKELILDKGRIQKTVRKGENA